MFGLCGVQADIDSRMPLVKPIVIDTTVKQSQMLKNHSKTVNTFPSMIASLLASSALAGR